MTTNAHLRLALAVIATFGLLAGAVTSAGAATPQSGATAADAVAPTAAHTLEADATIGAELAAALRVAPGSEPLEVIVSFWDEQGHDRFQALAVPSAPLAVLPMSVALLTPREITEIASWPETRGIHLDRDIELHNHQSVMHTGAPEVWAEGITGEGVGVAVVDTGIDGTHPDLAYPDKTVQNVKVLHTRHLYWSHGQDTETERHYAEDLPHTDTYGVGHGTHVAGTAAGSGEADSNYKGMAPGADVIGIGAGDGLRVYQALAGLEWLLIEGDDGVPNHERYNVRVVNNSWGTTNAYELDLDHPINQVTYELYRAGMVVVFSAGNSGPSPDTVNAYALPPWILSIGATNKIGFALTGFSSRGYPNHPFKTVDVAAPGQNIQSAMFYAWPANPYWGLSGTSMSAPHVSGLVALLAEANPDLSPDQIAAILHGTADPDRIEDAEVWEQGSGFIDSYAAYEQAIATPGERDAFLSGAVDLSFDEVEATAGDLPYERVDEDWTGTVGPGVLGVGDSDVIELTVDERAEFLTTRVFWDGTVQHLDFELTAPDGTTYSPSIPVDAVPLGSSVWVHVTLPEPGDWTLEVLGYAAAQVAYTAEVAQYLMHEDEDGSLISNW